MKRLYFSIMAFCMAMTSMYAEDVLQIVPQRIVPGNTMADENMFTIEMNNENTFVAMQFDLWLPEGVTINEESFELSDRFPYTRKTPNHNITCVPQSEGQIRITCSSTKTANEISGNDGVLFYIYYNADENMATGILPVRITDVVLAIDGNNKVKPANSVSFFYTPDVDWNAVTCVDLTTVEGVAVNDVVAGAKNLMANPNAVLFLNEGSAGAEVDNVVIDGTCQNFVLTDGKPFRITGSSDFTAVNASYTRTVANDGWYSVCLPFNVDAPAGVKIEELTSVEGDVLHFNEVNALEEETAYIFNAAAGTVDFKATNVEVVSTQPMCNGFFGTFSGMGGPYGYADIEGCYALRADGTGFGVCGANAYVDPFRAVIKNESGAKFLNIDHGTTTGINEILTSDSDAVYNIQGMRVNRSAKGVKIINGKKVVK